MSTSLHIHNARIWTGDPQQPWVRSITIAGGRIVVLSDDPARRPDEGATVIDGRGRTITPGLIDSHLHLLMGAKSLHRLDLSTVRSREEFEAAITARHAVLPIGEWLIAAGWSQENWAGNELPDKEWLAAAGERPVVCYRMDLHAVVVNNAVLRQCDLRHDPPGGRIVRDSSGTPTGVLIEAAAWQLVNPIVPEPDFAMRREHLIEAQRSCHSLGLTAVGSMEYSDDVRNVYLPMREQLTLRSRITLLDRDWPMDFSFGRNFPNDDRLAVIGYKSFIDGTLGSRTARMLEEYADDPGNRGIFVELTAAGALKEWACAVARSGLSPSMHAIGDEAARAALDAADAIEKLGAANHDRIGPRIEHAQQLALDDVQRFANRIASMQPLHKADDGRYVRRRLGERRLAGSFAFRRLLNAGAKLAFGSDWPVASHDPLLGIRAAVTGLTFDNEVFGADQNLTVEESLRAYTAGAAFALGMKDAGVLRNDALGDLVIFDRDPFAADWAGHPPRVVLTAVGGRIVYDAGAKD